MNKLHFFIKDNGNLFVFKGDLPEEPTYCIGFTAEDRYCQRCSYDEGCENDKIKYEEALQRAKKDAVLVDNQEDVIKQIQGDRYWLGINLKKDTIYSLEGCEMEVKFRPCEKSQCLTDLVCKHKVNDVCSGEHKVALITFSEKKEDKPSNMEEVTIYKFQLEAIAEALRVVANNYECRSKETCMDRMVTQAEQYAKNALSGEKEKIVKYL